MKVTAYRGLQPVVIEGVNLVLVESDAGTALSATSQFRSRPDGFVTKHCDEPGFSQLLAGLGLDRTVIVTRADGPRLADCGLGG